MSDNLAGGRKAQTMPRDFTGATEDQLNQQIAAMTAHLAFCLERSRSIPLADDVHGHARSTEVENAVALARISAKLAMTMGKMQGEFSYNFNYSHHRPPPPGGYATSMTRRSDVDLGVVTQGELEDELEERRKANEASMAAYLREKAATPPPSPESERFE